MLMSVSRGELFIVFVSCVWNKEAGRPKRLTSSHIIEHITEIGVQIIINITLALQDTV